MSFVSALICCSSKNVLINRGCTIKWMQVLLLDSLSSWWYEHVHHSTSVPRVPSSTLPSSLKELSYSPPSRYSSVLLWLCRRLFSLDLDFAFFSLPFPLLLALLSLSWKTCFKLTSFWGSCNSYSTIGSFCSYMTEASTSMNGRSLSGSLICVDFGVGSASSVSILKDFSVCFLRACLAFLIHSPIKWRSAFSHLKPLRLS